MHTYNLRFGVAKLCIRWVLREGDLLRLPHRWVALCQPSISKQKQDVLAHMIIEIMTIDEA